MLLHNGGNNNPVFDLAFYACPVLHKYLVPASKVPRMKNSTLLNGVSRVVSLFLLGGLIF